MSFIHTVFRNELKQLSRQKWLIGAFCAFIIVAILAISAGNRTVNARLVQIDSVQQAYQRDLNVVLKKFTDTTDAKGRAAAKSAGMAVMINFWLPQNTIKKPAPLAALSVGLMDIQPWQQQVKYTKSFNETTDMPVTNPMTLFAGNFDLAFVILYLMPLLVLAYCYSVFSSEKESGALTLLKIQAGNVHRLIRIRLLFRFIVLGILLLLVNMLGFVLAGKQTAPSFQAMALWCLATVLYLAFWMAVAYLVVALQRNTTVSGLCMISCWLLLLVVFPSLVNSYVQSKHPLPMRDEIASYRRHQGEIIWGTPARILADSFNRYNPQYAASIDPAKDTLHLSTRYVAGYYDLLERRMERVLVPFEEKVAERNRRFESLSWWNPALYSQHLLNSLSVTHLAAYQEFFRQQDDFQKKWQAFLYGYHMPGRQLTPADFKRFPVFNYQPPLLPSDRIAMQLFYIFLFISGLTACAFFLFNKKEKRV